MLFTTRTPSTPVRAIRRINILPALHLPRLPAALPYLPTFAVYVTVNLVVGFPTFDTFCDCAIPAAVRFDAVWSEHAVTHCRTRCVDTAPAWLIRHDTPPASAPLLFHRCSVCGCILPVYLRLVNDRITLRDSHRRFACYCPPPFCVPVLCYLRLCRAADPFHHGSYLAILCRLPGALARYAPPACLTCVPHFRFLTTAVWLPVWFWLYGSWTV